MFNINEFRAKIDARGGPSRNNLFVVEFSGGVIGETVGSDLRFFCQSIKLPGLDIESMEYMPQAFGLPQAMPMRLKAGDLSTVFMIDSSHSMFFIFHKWMSFIINYDVSGGIFSSVRDRLPYEIGYKDNYYSTMTVKHYTTSNTNAYYEYKFNDVFPTQIEGTTLSWSDNDSYTTAAINFSYSEMNFKGAVVGKPTERFARGTGLLNTFNSLPFGQTLIQSSIPKSIQQAIDTYSSTRNTLSDAKNALDQIRSIF